MHRLRAGERDEVLGELEPGRSVMILRVGQHTPDSFGLAYGTPGKVGWPSGEQTYTPHGLVELVVRRTSAILEEVAEDGSKFDQIHRYLLLV